MLEHVEFFEDDIKEDDAHKAALKVLSETKDTITIGVSDDGRVTTVLCANASSVTLATRSLVNLLRDNLDTMEFAKLLYQILYDATENDKELAALFGVQAERTN